MANIKLSTKYKLYILSRCNIIRDAILNQTILPPFENIGHIQFNSAKISLRYISSQLNDTYFIKVNDKLRKQTVRNILR